MFSRTSADLTARHVDELIRLGATVTGKHKIPGQHWTVLQEPEGNEFCIAAKSFTLLAAFRPFG